MRTSTSSFSQSASASTTFNTTADSPDGLESVTNLTRVSTSNTVYQTCASTSATLTRASTSATLTRASTSATLTRASTYETLTRASTWYTYTRASTSATLTRASTYATAPATANATQTSLTYHYTDPGPRGGYENTGSWIGWYSSTSVFYTQNDQAGKNISVLDAFGDFNMTYGGVVRHEWRLSQLSVTGAWPASGSHTLESITKRTLYDKSYYYTASWIVTTGTIYYTCESIYGYATRESIYGYETRESVYGYNTRQSVSGYATRESVSGYATRESVSGYGTRVSTSNTVYETRESISGYSGVSTSSSSSSESASGTCWK